MPEMFLSIGRIKYRTQWQTGLTLALAAVLMGITTGWTSPYLAELTAPDNIHPLKLTYSEASWIVTITFIGSVIGGVYAFIIQEFIGRKKALLSMCGPFFIGWTLIIIAPSVPWLYFGRLFAGMPTGIIFNLYGSFLGEIADPMIRGSLILMIPIAITIGVLLGTIMGSLLSMDVFSYICLGLTALLGLLFTIVPESPYYYIANGNNDKAEKSLLWYKKDADVKREMREMQEMIGNSGITFAERLKEIRKPRSVKNFLLVFFIGLFPYCAGLNTTESYAEIILIESKVDITPKIVVIFLTLCSMIAGIGALTLVDKVGRRPLVIGSGLGVGIGYIILGIHFHILHSGIDHKLISWLPVFSLFLVYFSMSSGLSTVLCTFVGELFPPILKTPASFIYALMSGVASIVVSKSFQPYCDLVGEKFVFWTFGIVALCSVVFSYFFLPETSRKSLKDIQDDFYKDRRNIDNPAADIETNNDRVNN